ncbi:hypothetical protein WOLCODRAFT_159417 [Wolfiporia cocos MD-104 SS10]|uniref:Uncharacterized protein n=1 Tax=Wolfiporia cocos (strain MD-104) TaxID=742152 RepID=A0A2H3JXA3_WOLCO|nr:hypothetical protein WOLCODRAFT_159417 [Wolfiporia cocos MD-104 SS10]
MSPDREGIRIRRIRSGTRCAVPKYSHFFPFTPPFLFARIHHLPLFTRIDMSKLPASSAALPIEHQLDHSRPTKVRRTSAVPLTEPPSHPQPTKTRTPHRKETSLNTVAPSATPRAKKRKYAQSRMPAQLPVTSDHVTTGRTLELRVIKLTSIPCPDSTDSRDRTSLLR